MDTDVARVAITPIPSYYITPIWGNVSELISSAVEYVDSGYTADDVRKALTVSEMQLWIAGDYQACAVTQINRYPQHKTCLIVAMAGEGMDEWFDELLSTIEEWASKMKCKYVEEYGRKGWRKIGASRGYEQIYTVMRKPVHGR
jgi:hypothetical protein